MPSIDIESLDPVQRMELADVLYDSAMQAIEDGPALTPEQIQEIDQRLERFQTGQAAVVTWAAAKEHLLRGR
jgi:hypothetical protein